MPVSESDMRAADKYRKNNCRDFTLRTNRKFDEDIIVWLESIENKQGYLKNLIREDMKKHGFVPEETNE